jgi:hypothetical protein
MTCRGEFDSWAFTHTEKDLTDFFFITRINSISSFVERDTRVVRRDGLAVLKRFGGVWKRKKRQDGRMTEWPVDRQNRQWSSIEKHSSNWFHKEVMGLYLRYVMKAGSPFWAMFSWHLHKRQRKQRMFSSAIGWVKFLHEALWVARRGVCRPHQAPMPVSFRL